MKKVKLIFVILTVIGTSFYSSYLHMVYTADKVSKVTGHFISVGALPFSVGAVIWLNGIIIVDLHISTSIKRYWWIPLLGSVSSLIPLAMFFWAMSRPH